LTKCLTIHGGNRRQIARRFAADMQIQESPNRFNFHAKNFATATLKPGKCGSAAISW
jgi:hypothetical protein